MALFSKFDLLLTQFSFGQIAGVLMLLASLVGFYVTAAMFIELEWPCKLPRVRFTFCKKINCSADRRETDSPSHRSDHRET